MGSLQNIVGNFKNYGIINFTPVEVQRTGADLKDVRIVTFCALQEVRTKIKRRIMLIFNGITTGNHSAIEHPNGLAVDFHLHSGDGPVDIRMLFLYAVRAGFNGIGIYWNGMAYSFHFDLRPEERFTLWIGTKSDPKASGWNMITIVGQSACWVDPVQLLNRLRQ